MRGSIRSIRLGAAALFASLVAALPASAQTATGLAGRLSAAMRLAGGASGAWAFDTDGGKLLFTRSAGTRRTPASVEKLLTSATALDRFGPGFRFETSALASGTIAQGTLDGDLYIKGAGDPSFSTDQLRRLAAAVASSGLQSVSGHVYGDESLFDGRRGGPASAFGVSPYVGPLSALAFNGGTNAPLGRGFQSDPPRFVAQRFRAALESENVDVTRSASVAEAPADAQSVASVTSAQLDSLVRHMNLISDNYYAETLLKGLGARFGATGSTTAGAGVVRNFERRIGVASAVVDGSGLSRADQVAPKAIGRLLLTAEREPWFDSYNRSLPLAGHSGTLASRMRGSAADGRCRAKTGTLAGVSGLAGYCRSASNHRVVFAILMNGVNVTRARAVQDHMAAALAAYSG